MSLNTILAELPKLTAQERQAIVQACAKLTARGEAPDPPAHLFMLIAKALGDPVSYAKLARASRAEWRSNLSHAYSLIEELDPGAAGGANRQVKYALFSLLLDLLIKDMRGRDAPVNLATVCSNLPRLQQVFDDSFPGYREGGMTPFLLKAMGARR